MPTIYQRNIINFRSILNPFRKTEAKDLAVISISEFKRQLIAHQKAAEYMLHPGRSQGRFLNRCGCEAYQSFMACIGVLRPPPALQSRARARRSDRAHRRRLCWQPKPAQLQATTTGSCAALQTQIHLRRAPLRQPGQPHQHAGHARYAPPRQLVAGVNPSMHLQQPRSGRRPDVAHQTRSQVVNRAAPRVGSLSSFLWCADGRRARSTSALRLASPYLARYT